jgi:hypothetical protein
MQYHQQQMRLKTLRRGNGGFLAGSNCWIQQCVNSTIFTAYSTRPSLDREAKKHHMVKTVGLNKLSVLKLSNPFPYFGTSEYDRDTRLARDNDTFRP